MPPNLTNPKQQKSPHEIRLVVGGVWLEFQAAEVTDLTPKQLKLHHPLLQNFPQKSHDDIIVFLGEALKFQTLKNNQQKHKGLWNISSEIFRQWVRIIKALVAESL